MDRLTRQIEAEGVSTPYLIRIAEGQSQMVAALEGRSDDGGAHVDAESRMRLRSIDVQLLRILEEMSAGRQESLSELRGDIAASPGRSASSAAGGAEMALTRRANRNVSASIWPGFVDAMTALLLVLMFVLTIFMVVQFVLRETISGQESELDILSRAGGGTGRRAGPRTGPQRRALRPRSACSTPTSPPPRCATKPSARRR